MVRAGAAVTGYNPRGGYVVRAGAAVTGYNPRGGYVVSSSPSVPAVLPTGVQVEWLLDETSGTLAADNSGNGRDGYLLGGPTFTAAEGVTLTGSPGRIVCYYSAPANGITMIVVASRSTSSTLGLMGLTDAGVASKALQMGEDYLRFYPNTTNTDLNISASPTIGANVPTFLAATLDYPERSIYLNGTRVVTSSDSGTGLGEPSEQLLVGTTTGGYFQGTVHYAAVFHRSLSQAEVAQAYAYVKSVLTPRGVSLP